MKKLLVALLTFVAVAGAAFLLWREAPANQLAPSYSFDERNRPILSGLVDGPSMDPKLGLRVSGAIYMLAVYGQESHLGLAISKDGGDSFASPVPISLPSARVVTHGANSPTLAIGPEEFYALWEQQSESGTDLMFARSIDYAYSFEEPIKVTDKTTPSWNGFSTLEATPNGDVYAAWLDTRDAGEGTTGTSALYITRSTDLGVSLGENRRVALDVCPCCRPAVTFGEPGEIFIAWRGVSEGDIRDMLVARSGDGGETFGTPVRVANDGWRIKGCPHSGPSMIGVGNRLYIAWFSEGTGSDAGVRLAWSDDGGSSFAPPVIASGDVLSPNQPRLSLSPDGRVFVVFQGRDPNAEGGWGVVKPYLVQVNPANGDVSVPIQIPEVERAVSSPALLAGSQGRVYVAWTERPPEGSRIMFRRMRLLD